MRPDQRQHRKEKNKQNETKAVSKLNKQMCRSQSVDKMQLEDFLVLMDMLSEKDTF